MKKTMDLGKDSVIKLLMKYSVPAVLAMLVGAVYNIVDRIYIGQFVGEEALAGVTLDFPLMLAVMALASMVEAGSSSLIAIELGKNNRRLAGKYFGNAIGLGVIISGLFIAFMWFNLSSVIAFLGGVGLVADYAVNYMRIILMGILLQVVASILSSTVRVDGHPNLSMIAMIVSALTNIVLDYVFIGLMGMGVEGAALATIIGQGVGFVILVGFYLSGKSTFEFHSKDFIPKKELSLKAMGIGVSSLVTVMGMSVSMLILNIQLLNYGDTVAVTAVGIINGLYSFFIMPIMGIQQGMQPILGFNYGAGQNKRVIKTLKAALVIAIAYSSIFFGILQAYPEWFVSLFIKDSAETMTVTIKGMRLITLMLPVLSINYFGVAFYQSVGKGKMALLLSLLRQLVIFVPALFILPMMFGLTGVWAAQPVADGISIVIVGVALVYGISKMLVEKENPTVKNQMSV